MFNEGTDISGKHFRISDRPVENWGPEDLVINGYHIWCYDNQAITITKNSGELIGLIFGIVIDYNNRNLVAKSLSYVDKTAKVSNKFDTQEFEKFLYQFGGRWVALLLTGDVNRIYLDADASMGVVYSHENHLAGSSASAILSISDYREKFEKSMHKRLDVSADGWFPAGLTAHRGITRIIPNHYLDMNEWRQFRHWPKSDFDKIDGDYESALRKVCSIVSAQIETLSKYKICFALTAGNESRFLLSCSGNLRGAFDYVTIDVPGSTKDIHVARSLAKMLGLKHRILPLKFASPSEVDAWYFDAGHCVGSKNAYTYPTTYPLKEYDYFIGGLGGEVGRGFLYRGNDHENTSLDAKKIMSRLGLPRERLVVSMIDNWLDDLPHMSTQKLLDLAYVELRMGPWAFSSSYTRYFTNEVHPLICREIYELFFNFPSESKMGNPLVDAIELLEPSLLSIPINKYGDYRDYMALIPKILSPRSVIKAIRKKMM